MNKYTGLIKCGKCNHNFKGRKERNNINYRCNFRLKFGKNKCSNDAKVEEDLLDNMIQQQLYVLNIDVKDINLKEIVNQIIVSPDRIEIFFKNLPIKSCYIDSKEGKLHYDSLHD